MITNIIIGIVAYIITAILLSLKNSAISEKVEYD